MFGAFGAFFFSDAKGTGGFLDSNPVLSLALLLVIAMLVSMGVAILLERIAYRPLRNAPRLVPLITAIGASLFLQNTARGSSERRAAGSACPKLWTVRGRSSASGRPHPGGRARDRDRGRHRPVVVRLEDHDREVDAGRGGDSEIASLMGIPVDRVIVTTFAIGGCWRARRGAVLDHVRVGELHDGLPPRDRGVHGGGPGRDRQHPAPRWAASCWDSCSRSARRSSSPGTASRPRSS